MVEGLVWYEDDLVLNPEIHRQPMEFLQNWKYMVIFPSATNQSGSTVLYI